MSLHNMKRRPLTLNLLIMPSIWIPWIYFDGQCRSRQDALKLRMDLFEVYSTKVSYALTLVLLNQDRHCLWKQCRSRSDGFWRSHLIRTYTVFHWVCQFIWTNNIESSDWLTVRNGCGKLNLFSRIRVNRVREIGIHFKENTAHC